MEVLKKRSEVAVEDTWALEDIFPSIEVWEETCKKAKELLEGLKRFEGHLGDSAVMMEQFYEEAETVSKMVESAYQYACMHSHEDLGNNEWQVRTGKAQNLYTIAAQVMAFEEPELLAMGEEKVENFMKESEALYDLKMYFARIFRTKEHILSPEIEAILAKTADMSRASSDIFTMFNNAELKFPAIKDEQGNEVAVSHGRYGRFMESKNREIRKAAFDAMYSTYEKYINTIATTFMANLKQESFYAQVRKYPSARAMELSGSNIPEAVYDNLIESIHDALPMMHRYVRLRKKMLGVDELHMYDVYAPMVKDYDCKYTIDEAKELVVKALAPMGEEYQRVLKEAFANRWIDVYENEGKRSGAYSWGPYGTHPYVLMNFQGNLNNTFTLAHEMGHAMHSYYSAKTQPYKYAHYRIFVAEVASTCNEALLMHYMLEHASSKEEKLHLINQFLEKFKGTMYRQTMFAEFEKIVHGLAGEGEALSAKDFNKIYLDLNKKYFGEDMVSDPYIAYEWAKIPHFYTPFYVYQYSTGFAAAMALSKRILTLGEEGVKDYMKFLTGGSSKDPIDLLRLAGVDMETKEPVIEALSVFDSLLDQFEALV